MIKNMEKQLGKIYAFCDDCERCPVAIEAEVSGQSGLQIKDDFGGFVQLTDQNLKDLKNFLGERFKA
jgi:hypothetical protein